MPAPPVRTRFAPSPTGLMHLGNARTALFNALLARRHGGRFVLRIEDTDPERSRPVHVDALREDLLWLGLPWDEGPGRGDGERYFQSARGGHYHALYGALESAGRAYPCFCTESELAAERRAQARAGQPPRYGGRCRGMGAAQVAAMRAQGRPAALRFQVDPGRVVEFDDLVRGPQRVDCGHIGDFIIRRSDGTPAFLFGNAVDDADMRITHVLRGEDHLANTPRQVLLLEALGLRAPRYGHLSLIVGGDGVPLSKRHGAAAVADLRRDGYLAAAVVNYLARLGHALEDERILDVDALAAVFDTARLGRSPAHFDAGQLEHWQRAAVHRLDADELRVWAGAACAALVPAEHWAGFADAVRPNVTFPPEAEGWARVLFSDDWALEAEAENAIRDAGESYFVAALAALDTGSELLPYLKERLGVRGRRLFQPLRAALTGRLSGPELADVLRLLPPHRTRKRLEDAVEVARGGRGRGGVC